MELVRYTALLAYTKDHNAILGNTLYSREIALIAQEV